MRQDDGSRVHVAWRGATSTWRNGASPSARKSVTSARPILAPARAHLPTRETMATKKTSSPIKKVTKGKKGSFQKFRKGMHQQAKANDQKITSAEISAKWNELGEGATYVFGGATDAPEA